MVVTPDSEPGLRWFDSNPRSCSLSEFSKRAHRPTEGRRLRTPEIRVRISVGPLRTPRWKEIATVVHRSSRGPKATTLGSHPGNGGSIPSGTILIALVEQSGVLATLSRWRPWVQIPSRALVMEHRSFGRDITIRRELAGLIIRCNRSRHGTPMAERPSSNLGS